MIVAAVARKENNTTVTMLCMHYLNTETIAPLKQREKNILSDSLASQKCRKYVTEGCIFPGVCFKHRMTYSVCVPYGTISVCVQNETIYDLSKKQRKTRFRSLSYR